MSDDDYGDVAVEQPAERALEYGRAAVESGVLLAQGPQKAAPKRRAGTATPPRLFVNPASRFTALRWAQLLKLKAGILPAFLTKGIIPKSADREIILPSALPVSKQPHPQWLRDFIAIDQHWEVTTGTMEVVVSGGRVRGRRIVGDVQKGSGDEDAEAYGVYDRSLQMVIPKAFDIIGGGSRIILGKTIPPPDLMPEDPTAEAVLLRSGRGLIIVAIDVKAVAGGRFAPDPPYRIHDAIIAMNLVHEIAAHAGLFSQGLPASHGDQRVNDNVAAIEAGYAGAIRAPLTTLLSNIPTYTQALIQNQP
jgi:hypothetical protein